MIRNNRLRAFALLAVATLLAPVFASDLTVGHFYSEIAKIRHMPAVDASSVEAGLRAAGFKLPALALNKALTEGDVIGISNAMGIHVTTQRPSQPFGEQELTVFSAVFGQQLKGAAVDGHGIVYQVNGNSQGQNNNNQGQNNDHQGDKSPSHP
ncbi:MAG TPA: hypothetical protein VFV19_18535 [Candidatus Polarisedimenticolaceae bacterium]|nr:hypothetical protein [Candidatus Polarisedimenticolaceae bacterium]